MALLFSAFWHGIKPGYYISFYTTVGVAYAQKYFKHAFNNWLPPYQGCYKLVDVVQSAVSRRSLPLLTTTIIAWFINIRLIEYSILPFLLLESVHDFISVWKDVYFYGHVYIVVLFLSGFIKKQCSKLKYH